MIRRSPRVRRNSKLILILLVLLLAGRNKILLVQASCATDARNPTPRDTKNVCKAQNAICDGCGVKGHYKIACKKSGNLPQKSHFNPQNPSSTGRMNIVTAVEEAALSADFFDEKGFQRSTDQNK